MNPTKPSTKPTLYLLLGYPGAGKTTAAASIARVTDAVHISSDQVRRELFPTSEFSQAEHDRLYTELDKRVVAFLEQGKSVVYDANLNRYIHRQEKYDFASSRGVDSILVWVKTPERIARERRVTTEPQHDLVPAHESVAEMFDRIAGLFEPPRANEHSIELDGTQITDEYVRIKLGI